PVDSVLVDPLLAAPLTKATGAPKLTPSILNCTEPPLGLPAPAPVPTTVALKLTLSPNVDGFTVDDTVVSVLRLLTVWPPSSRSLLSLKFVSEEVNTASTVCVPALSVLMEPLFATPLLRRTGEPKSTP